MHTECYPLPVVWVPMADVKNYIRIIYARVVRNREECTNGRQVKISKYWPAQFGQKGILHCSLALGCGDKWYYSLGTTPTDQVNL